MNVRDLDYIIDTDDSVYQPQLLKENIMKKTDYRGISITTYKIKELCAVYEADFRKQRIPTAVTLTPVKQG